MISLTLSLNGGVARLDRSGLRLEAPGMPAWRQPAAVSAQIVLDARGSTEWLSGAYTDVRAEAEGVVATGTLTLPGNGRLAIEDRWFVRDGALRVRRTARVDRAGNARGFLTAFELEREADGDLDSVEPFMPATMYGDNDFLPPDAIGSRRHRELGVVDFLCREDTLPAPLVAVRDRAQGGGLLLLHAAPDGATTLSDAIDLTAHTLIDERFQFGSIGLRQAGPKLRLAFWFPGTEGGAAHVYFDWGKRRYHPHNWRGRYHPLREGFTHTYELVVAPTEQPQFPAFLGWAWRRAMDALQPAVAPHDLDLVEQTVIAHLAGMVETHPNGAVGVPYLLDSTTGHLDDGFYELGFCGRNEGIALHLLRVGHRDGNADYLAKGRAILEFWVSRTPAGFGPVAYRPNLQRFGGQDWFIHPRSNVRAPRGGEAISLREFAEGRLGCLRAWAIERAHGVEHNDWIAWCRGAGEFLVREQAADGGFPRWWETDGEVLDPSTTGAFNAIPFLVELHLATGEPSFLAAAIRAGELLWSEPQVRGIFRGGTIDNPDVIDKEAASLSMEAFLALHEATRETRWLDAAKVAADVTATWMYLWDVPMPMDADPDGLDWKPGVSTVGVSVVAVAGQGCDQYLAWNADDFTRLGALTGDPLYTRTGEILGHNTKGMLALPGRTFDLLGPGWQQEHWRFGINRGNAAHRAWLPWVTVCHLSRFR